MYAKSLLFAVLAIFAASHAQVISIGKCPKGLTIQQDFDLSQFLGKWYEYSKYTNIFELNGICNQAEYTSESEGIVKVNNTMFDLITRKFRSFVADAYVVDSGRLNLGQPSTSKSNYNVLETDYKNYAVIQSCEEAGFLAHTQFIWILTRKSSPKEKIVEKALNVLKVNNISTKELKTVQQICN